MSFFDSPIARCDAVHKMVLTDQTQQECALDNECSPERDCPLARCFVKTHVLERSPRTDGHKMILS